MEHRNYDQAADEYISGLLQVRNQIPEEVKFDIVSAYSFAVQNESVQRRMKKGWKNLSLYRVHPDNCGRPKRPVVALSSSRILYFKCINDAATWCNGAASNIRRCCHLNSNPVNSSRKPNADHQYLGIRFYYEADVNIWSAKLNQH